MPAGKLIGAVRALDKVGAALGADPVFGALVAPLVAVSATASRLFSSEMESGSRPVNFVRDLVAAKDSVARLAQAVAAQEAGNPGATAIREELESVAAMLAAAVVIIGAEEPDPFDIPGHPDVVNLLPQRGVLDATRGPWA